MKCKNCGFEFDEGIFCPECGTKYEEAIVKEATEEVVEEVSPETVVEKQQEAITEEVSKDKKEEKRKEKANAKANKAGRWVIYAIIIAVSIVIVSNMPNKADNTDTSDGLTNVDSETKNDEVADVYNDLEIVAKKENGSTINRFKQLGDKLFISSDYEECEFQCPYELILKEKNLDLYDRVCLIEHRVDEVIEDKDEDGNYVEIIDGVNHYFLDTIRVMCEYSSSDDLFTVKKYYNICMTNWLHENWNEWSSITTEYVFNDEELNYSNFNDTYWYIEGDDILNIGMENLIDWENGEEYLNYADLKVYMHFYDLGNVPIESIWEDGTFRTSYEDHYEIGTVKVLYNGRKIEKKLYAGGTDGDGFLQAGLTADEGLRVNIGIHAVDEESYNNNRTTVKYVETIDANKYVGGTYPMVQISMSEYGNDSDIYSEKEEFSEDNIGGQDILYEVIADAPDGYVNVRTDTTTDSMVIYEARNGNLFSVTGEYGDWIEVALHPTGTNPFGYIHSSQVTRLSKTPNSNFIIEGSDSGYFGEAFLEGFSAWDCRLARNEIYARHGKIFKDEALQTYFNSFSGIWYTPEYEDVPDSMLNQWEIDNVKTIIGYEEKMGYR